jgi:hypothetical protein
MFSKRQLPLEALFAVFQSGILHSDAIFVKLLVLLVLLANVLLNACVQRIESAILERSDLKDLTQFARPELTTQNNGHARLIHSCIDK